MRDGTPTPSPTPSPTALQLDIQGTATDTHMVELSAAEVTDIAENHRVSKVSSTDSGHDHKVTFN